MASAEPGFDYPDSPEQRRRESLGAHGRQVEDLIEAYTRAVHDDDIQGWFGRLAAELMTLRQARDGRVEKLHNRNEVRAAIHAAYVSLGTLIEELEE